MEPPLRPTMRRKSSASTLLSPFQGTRAGSAIPNNASLKEWETNSPSSDGTMTATGGGGGATLAPSSSIESLRETLSRRILAIAHIRQSYEGKQHWLNTVLIDGVDLERTYNNATMRKRTWKFAVLGMSLSTVFDVKGVDIIKALTTILNEYDQMPDQPPDETSRPKRSLLRGKQAKRAGAGAGISSAGIESLEIEHSLAIGVNIPFPLDYFQVLITFCDILTEVYIKLRDLVNALPPLHSGMIHSVPPGSGYWIRIQMPNSSNNPLYSQLFPADHASPRNIPDLASPQPASASFIPASMTSPSSTSNATGSGIVDTVLKLDSRFKKIVNQLLKELDVMARDSIRDELSSLDPLLRNTTLTGSNESAPVPGLVFE